MYADPAIGSDYHRCNCDDPKQSSVRVVCLDKGSTRLITTTVIRKVSKAMCDG